MFTEVMMPGPEGNAAPGELLTRTFLLTDIEGSTRLWREHPDAMRSALARHDELLTAAVEGSGGRVFKRMGDATFGVFPTARAALDAALRAQRDLTGAFPDSARPPALRVRIALHSGDVEARADDYFGTPLNHVARLCGAIHGGQIAASEATERLLRESGMPPEVRLQDLGEHRLRDLNARERIFQVVAPGLRDQFPPVRSLDALPNNLPHQLTSFVGREAEIADVRARLLGTPPQRLLTLTGAGGTGKTRLALQCAGDVLPHYADGAFLVDLAPLTEPEQLYRPVADALALRESAERPISAEVLAYLSDKRLLLILDNCEHVVSACARLGSEIVRRCPGVSILATSREPLGVAGEHVLPVPPLATPARPGRANLLPPDDHAAGWVDSYPALRLFAERARAAAPGFAIRGRNVFAVAEVCRRLDGIPLALELVAAWAPTLAPEQMEQHLSQIVDAPSGYRTSEERHRTLRATLDWSYDLLSEAERTLLRRLSVFAGGWTLEGARDVCSDASLPDFQVVVALNGLVQKSLVVRQERTDADPRYRLLETIREYAARAMASTDEADALRKRHQEFFLRASEAAEPHLRGAEQKQWLDRLEDEAENLRAAMSPPGDAENALRIATAVSWYWCVRGHFTEGRERLEAVIAAPHNAPAATVGRACSALGVLLLNQGQTDEASARLNEALTIFDRTGDDARAAAMRANLGIISSMRGDYESAKTLLTGALDYFRATGDDARVSRVLSNLVAVLIEQKEFDDALIYLRESIATSQRLGDQHGVAVRLHNMGEIALRQKRYEEARGIFLRELHLSQQLNDFHNLACCLQSLGNTAWRKGDREESIRFIARAAKLRETHGIATSEEVRETTGRIRADAIDLWGDEAFLRRWQEGSNDDNLVCLDDTATDVDSKDDD